MPTCSDCGGTVMEYDAAAGNGFCVACGTVIEENTIVNELAFGESSSGAATVQGSYVALGATRARMSGPFGNRGGGESESREQTIANATKKIQSMANILRLSDSIVLAATRLYTLAVEHKFTKGRKSMNVAAVCLYVACRQKETRTHMLIDFSDILQVNVFELGHCYLQLVQTLNLRLPLVDPSHYVQRFASMLEFGDETSKVAVDAVRLVARFDRDWMTRGRRPAGICGCALLLAARMNNFRRSLEEIAQVVKIADTTLKKRLEEFKKTPSGNLTVGDFRSVWLEEEVDPPAFTRGREKEEEERVAREEGEEAAKQFRKAKKSKKRKRKRSSDDEAEDTPQPEAEISKKEPTPIPLDPALLNTGILEGTTDPVPLFIPDPEDHPQPQPPSPEGTQPLGRPESTPLDELAENAVAEEVTSFLQLAQSSEIAEALEVSDSQRFPQIAPADELLGLDEDELDAFILDEAEVKVKERLWVELNRDYLEALAAKGDQSQEKASKSRKKRKVKPRDASNPQAATTEESVRNLLKKNPKYSKRINYDALKDMFVQDNRKSEEPLYKLDDKDDPSVVVEEEDGFAGPLKPGLPEEEDEDGFNHHDGGISFEDAYQQEV
ncbi:BRF1-domain-containing protein [Cylindrobasidium torrendii FP15055 ss-10]|uniref:B-related factor 1 n=1 Tax=Cylindrobasidium torrendii FP15055 ss-10 TaxID=1314674 RepID=A0A0D7B869_9AGAR|nr:BRF1-domain-containing protein [Cylindrobasidium torrendii FP15055 ss-10]